MKNRIALLVLAVSLAALSVTGFVVSYQSYAMADSGISACQKMADNIKNGTKKSSNTPMTEEDYKKALEPFEQSRHDDVRSAGMNVVISLYNLDQLLVSQNERETTLEDLAPMNSAMGELQSNWVSLQAACQKHDITVPPLPTS